MWQKCALTTLGKLLPSGNMIKRTIYFGNPVYLSLSNAQMMIKKQAEDAGNGNATTGSIPIEDIGVVVLDNRQITITSMLLSALLDNNVAIVSCDGKSMPTGLMLPLYGNTLQSERFAEQIGASLPLKKQLWQQTIEAKIWNQAAVLSAATGEVARNMYAWSGSVKSGDANNIEGRAAAYYWRNIFPEIPFFVRDRNEAPPNNLLNYGYAILRAVVARALVAAGLIPTLGIHHHNRYNAYCLADDIMEPYRPYVDNIVVDIIKSGDTAPSLTKEYKTRLLQIPILDVAIDGKRSPLMIAVSSTATSLVKCFNGECRKILYPTIE